ncbi:MAG TPA: hypothetical protein VHQ43_11930 [Solirubrobacterales bacterium]|nr:hypothetical protein [Solirubrobacterales bacterium]
MRKFEKAAPVRLKTHETFNEKWLHRRLAEDPGLLGLGDLEVKEIERPQPGAGRLDLLLTDPETRTRYEVEVQLGPTDPAHIIRTIEYWDIEKARFPQYEHVAVLVAEDITSRFLNVIALFNKAIPLIAIQMNALEVGSVFTLQATTVLDTMTLATDEEDEPGQATDREYWIRRGSKKSVELADSLRVLVNKVTRDKLALKYNKHYIGLSRDGVADNFVQFRARKDYLIAEFRIERSDDVTALIEEADVDSLPYEKRWGRYRLRLTRTDARKHKALLMDLIARASGTTPAVGE